MMYKEIPAFEDAGDTGVLFRPQDGLNKVAHFNTHIPEKLASLIKEIEADPDPDYAYLYDRALGAGEVYGPNNNGDYFERGELKDHHHTFEKEAALYRHHKNKGPNIGDVMASAYNEPLDTVDLIIRAPIEKIARDLSAFENNQKLIQTSMGAKVKHDVCSICGNKARTRAHYCHHLRGMMLRTMPDGRLVYAKNPEPRFVDISIVVIHADPASAMLRKIAHKTASEKYSSMTKRDINNTEQRDVLRPEFVEATNHLDRGDALQTLHYATGGPLRPDEFQAVLRKDASLLRHDIIPYVGFKKMEKMAMRGRPLFDLVEVISNINGLPVDEKAQYKMASFLSPEEYHFYMTYRNSIGDFSKDFLR